MCSLLVKKNKKIVFFVSEKKKYSRISRIFKFAFFSSQSRLLHWYDFHALLHNGLLSIDATLQTKTKRNMSLIRRL